MGVFNPLLFMQVTERWEVESFKKQSNGNSEADAVVSTCDSSTHEAKASLRPAWANPVSNRRKQE